MKQFTLKSLLLVLTILMGGVNAWGEELSIDFENAADSYADWTFVNMTSQQTGTITAHGGT